MESIVSRKPKLNRAFSVSPKLAAISIPFRIRTAHNLCSRDFVTNIGFAISREKIIGRLKHRTLTYLEELPKILSNSVLELTSSRAMFFEFLPCTRVTTSSNNRKFMRSRRAVLFLITTGSDWERTSDKTRSCEVA